MPKENIERAVKRGSGTGEDGAALEEVNYEGYGPHGVAILMQVVTDNRNRTVSEIRRALTAAAATSASRAAWPGCSIRRDTSPSRPRV